MDSRTAPRGLTSRPSTANYDAHVTALPHVALLLTSDLRMLLAFGTAVIESGKVLGFSAGLQHSTGSVNTYQAMHFVSQGGAAVRPGEGAGARCHCGLPNGVS